MTPIIAPSILSADFGKLDEDVEMLNQSSCDWIHCDIMDGRFVPNISFGFPVLKAIKRKSRKPLDVHLMILEPERYVESFKKAGANHISVHIEACPHLHRNIEQIKSLDMKAGVAVNPHTPISSLTDILGDVDIVLLMSVNPGFGGQSFISHTLNKIRELRKIIDDNKLDVKIEIDGGVTLENAKDIVAAGADVLVAGNTVFHSKDPRDTISQLSAIEIAKTL